LEEAGYEVDLNKIPQDELPEKLPAYDVIIVRSATKVRQELIDQCPNLKVIARGGVGMDNIDVEYARSKGIQVMNTPAASSESVAELVFAHLFSLARSLHLSNRQMPSRAQDDFKALKKSYSKGFQLRGKTLGIVGFGRIGQEVARIGLALGMKVLPVDLYVDQADIDIDLYSSDEISLHVKVNTTEMDEMLRNSDIITLHVPFKGGKALLGKEEMAKMKQGVVLVNSARGGVIDEAALLEALESGQVRSAALDVFENEPTPDARLTNHDKISVSPHIGASTLEAQRNIGLELADRILAHFGADK
ncbi:MAG: D-2-hydroxyacid dehydrogenase, partial [Bacteroidota bacterium]